MEFRDEFIILKKGKFKETDLWLRVLSPRFGLKTFFAFGGLVSKKRFCGCLQEFCLLAGLISQSKRGNYLVLQEAYLKQNFMRCIPKANLGILVNVVDFLDQFKTTPEENPKLFALFLELLQVLNQGRDFSFLPLFFKTKLIFDLGFLPLLDQCAQCGQALEKVEKVFFSFAEGKGFCPVCAKSFNNNLSLIVFDWTLLSLLKFLASSKPTDWIEYKSSQELRQACFQVITRFSQYHLNLKI